ncbi:hypothetical protein C8R44DRAFT_631816, partial [Mycena epipterygia]
DVVKSASLDLVFGHSYRIGGSLELLSAGVAPEVIMKLGGWSSLCFLIYWRRCYYSCMGRTYPRICVLTWTPFRCRFPLI